MGLQTSKSQSVSVIFSITNKTVDSFPYLEVSIDNVVLMKIAKSRNNFRSVEPCTVFGEDTHLREMVEQLTTVYIFHHKTELICCLKRVSQML